MDVAFDDSKYKQALNKIEELEKKLESTYKFLKNTDNEHLKEVINNYNKYIKFKELLKNKKKEAFENILEHIEKIENCNKKDLKIISNELKKFF